MLLAGLAGVQAEKLTDAQKKFVDNGVVKKRACMTCHAVGGSGGTVGPKLDFAGSRRDAEWLARWLKDPTMVRPGTLMPNFGLTEAEIDELVALIADLKGDVDVQALLSGDGTLQEKGHRLFTAHDCTACHRVGDDGRFIGPDLTWLARRRTPEWETKWLANPDAVKPGTFMPNFDLQDDAREALVAYLMTLNGGANKASQDWEAITAFQLSSRPREIGDRIYRRFGCDGCHGRRGVGGYTNPNAQPNELMPVINRAALDYTEAEITALLMSRRSPEKLDAAGPKPLPCPSWKGAIADDELEPLYAYLKSITPKS